MVKRLAIVLITVVAAWAPADIAVTVSTSQAALVVQDTRFNPAVQLASDLTAGFGTIIQIGESARAGIGAGIGLGAVRQSEVNGGVVYRGMATRHLSLESWFSLASGMGVRLAGKAVLASYELTTLLFFYPEISLAPQFTLPIGPRSAVTWSLPISYQFRQDLQFALSAGVLASWHLEFNAP